MLLTFAHLIQGYIAVLKSVEAERTFLPQRRYILACYYNWKAKYGGMEPSDIKKSKDSKEENRYLQQMFADLGIECRTLKDDYRKKL